MIKNYFIAVFISIVTLFCIAWVMSDVWGYPQHNVTEQSKRNIDTIEIQNQAIGMQRYKICLQLYCIKKGQNVNINAIDSAYFSENPEVEKELK